MSWQEVPFRIGSVLRASAQRHGYLSADRVPRQCSDAAQGVAWCQPPATQIDSQEIVEQATRILHGKLQVFGQRVPFDERGVPAWNVDPVTGIQIPLQFGPFIDFRHIGGGIDIKHLWEVNRHLWWVTLAQAWSLTKEARFLERLGTLATSWLDACPYQKGPNWTSPVEHSIRLINWSIVWSLIGGDESPLFAGVTGQQLRTRWLDSIYQHMRFCRDNYSFYSSADNHLIGEAAGIFVAAHTWDLWHESRHLRAEAKQILEREALRQFSPDGVNLEQALCYHKFSLQFLLASALVAAANDDPFSDAFWSRIEAAIVYLAAVTDCNGSVPKYGDADDGEVWGFSAGTGSNSYHAMLALGSALFEHSALQAKAAVFAQTGGSDLPWLRLPDRRAAIAPGEALPTTFTEGGYILLGHRLHTPQELRVFMDCGPLGFNRVGGHEHADALSLELSCAGDRLLVDSGTYCYNASPALRHFFRGTHSHNTLVVDDRDQSIYGASFLWLGSIRSTIVQLDTTRGGTIHAHHDGYLRLPDPVLHHRRVRINDDGSVLVEDWLECRSSHDVSLLWHCAAGTRLQRTQTEQRWNLESDRHRLEFRLSGPIRESHLVIGQDAPPQGWVSDAFYSKEAAPVLRVGARMSNGDVLRTLMTVTPKH